MAGFFANMSNPRVELTLRVNNEPVKFTVPGMPATLDTRRALLAFLRRKSTRVTKMYIPGRKFGVDCNFPGSELADLVP